jgi:hypothetical protein
MRFNRRGEIIVFLRDLYQPEGFTDSCQDVEGILFRTNNFPNQDDPE